MSDYGHSDETSGLVYGDHGVFLGTRAHTEIPDSGFLRDRAILPSTHQREEAEHPSLAGYYEAERLLREGVDIVTGGFPCQDISTAGKGAGIQFDESTGEAFTRSGLFGQLVRTIRLVRPRFAILENVAALLSRGMGTVLGLLAEIGYDSEWDCISASNVGAPHIRERIWIVAHTNDQRESQPEGRERDQWRRPINGGEELAHSESIIERRLSKREEKKISRPIIHGETVADTQCQGLSERRRVKDSKQKLRESRGIQGNEQSSIIQEKSAVQYPDSERFKELYVTAIPGRARLSYWRSAQGREQWEFEPDVGRVANGVSMRVDKLSGLGNAVVPQIPEIIGEAIAEKIRGECIV